VEGRNLQIDARWGVDNDDSRFKLVWHGVLLIFGAPCQLLLLAGPEHGRTIPLAALSTPVAALPIGKANRAELSVSSTGAGIHQLRTAEQTP
jgi:hypothetical protein